MSYQVLPVWEGSDHSDTGPVATIHPSMDEALREVHRWISKPRPGLRVIVTDNVTWRKMATYRPKSAARRKAA